MPDQIPERGGRQLWVRLSLEIKRGQEVDHTQG